MPLPTTGPISLSQIQTEFGGTNPISLSEYYGAASGVPASGELTVSDFYGKSSTNTAFELTIQTPTLSNTFQLPMRQVTSINIDWGDGTIDTNITADNPTHTYATAGTYNISVTGTADTVRFYLSGSQNSLLSVTNLGSLGWTDFSSSFRGCPNLTTFDCGECDTSSATAMAFMFDNCTGLVSANVSNFDTSLVSSILDMFENCPSLENLDVTTWDITSVTVATDFLNLSNNALTTAQYDATLIAWAAQAVQSNVAISFGDAQYTAGGAAETARNVLVNTYGWTITDGGAAPSSDFQLTIETTTTNEFFEFPMRGVTSIDVDWGDGTVDSNITTDFPTHTYATAGTYNIQVSGTADRVDFGITVARSKLRTVTNLGSLGWTTFENAFQNCTNLTSFLCGNTDTSSVTNMRNMFRGCNDLVTLDVSSFDTSSVTDMYGMFNNCNSLTTLDVSSFDTSIVTIMQDMFAFCVSLATLDVSGFNTSSATNIFRMFYDCQALENLDIDGWDVSSVTIATNLLFNANNALTTAQYDELLIAWAAQAVQSNVTIHFGNATYTANSAASAARNTLTSTYGWNITDGGSVANNAFEFTIQTSSPNELFRLPAQDVTSIDVNWGDGTVDTGVTTNNKTHSYATAGTYTVRVTGTAGRVQFYELNSVETQLRSVLNIGSLGWTTFENSFRTCSNLTSFVAGNCNTSNVTSMFNMFNAASSLTTVDLSGFNSSSVTDMSSVFYNCGSLTTVDVSTLNTSIVTNMSRMFEFCSSLTTVDVSGFDTSNVTGLLSMFASCSSLENLDIDGWNVTSLTNALSFLNGANLALTTAQYDAILIAWAAQAVQQDVTIHFGDAQYTAGGAAETAHNTLVSTYGWTITDGGSV